MNQLEILRESLGQCDEIILDALIMRNRIVEDIMAYKEANGLQILQPEQEAKQKEWLEKRMEGRRHKDEVSDVFECIRTNSKRIQARKLFNYNIVLIGFMGAGKSTISDFLKNVFAMDVVEMDQIIAQRQGMSISDIFETYGEQYFRDLETNLLIEMQSRSNVVISCGGGTPMRECNVVEMKKNGRVVLLTAKPETILDRVKDNHDRPLIENNKTYDPSEALELCCKTATAKFDETVELHVRLGVDSRHADQQVRGAVVLPNGTGKNVRVIAIAKGDAAKAAEAAGAQEVGDDDLIAKIAGGYLDFDVLVTTPDMMGRVGRLGKVLGPRGLMPNPKAGTVTPDVGKAVTDAKAGKIEYRLDKQNIIHVPIGKASFGAEKLMTNLDTVLDAIAKAKPAAAKGQYFKSATIATTMGPGVRVATNKYGV